MAMNQSYGGISQNALADYFARLMAQQQGNPSPMMAGDVVPYGNGMRPYGSDYSRRKDEEDRLKKLQGVPIPGNDNSNVAPYPATPRGPNALLNVLQMLGYV